MAKQANKEDITQYKNILLDIGDTLVEISEPFEKYTQKAISSLFHKFPTKVTSLEDFISSSLMVRNYIRKSAHKTLIEAHIHDFFREMEANGLIDFEGRYIEAERTYIQAELEITNLFSDVIPFLEYAKSRGRRLIIATNNFSPLHVKELLRKYEIDPFIETSYISGESTFRKPNPMFFTQIINDLALVPSETIIIGDKVGMDIVGGNNAHINTCLIRRNADFEDVENAQIADFWVSSLN